MVDAVRPTQAQLLAAWLQALNPDEIPEGMQRA